MSADSRKSVYMSKGQQMDDDEIMTPEQVSDLTKLSLSQLSHLRWNGTGPRFYKPTSRIVRYRRSVVLAWLESIEHSRTDTPVASAR